MCMFSKHKTLILLVAFDELSLLLVLTSQANAASLAVQDMIEKSLKHTFVFVLF